MHQANLIFSYNKRVIDATLSLDIPIAMIFEELKNTLGMTGPSSDYIIWHFKTHPIVPVPIGSIGINKEKPIIIFVSKKDFKTIDTYLNSYFPNLVAESLQAPQEGLYILNEINRQSIIIKHINEPDVAKLVESIFPRAQFENLEPLEKVKQITNWFSTQFFQRIKTPVCHACGGPTVFVGPVPIIQDEIPGHPIGAEFYKCHACGAGTRLARFTHPCAILKTKFGKEPEAVLGLASIFKYCGFQFRFVLIDASNHLLEVYIPKLKRFVSVDPYANLVDSPLVYECGWGRQINWAIAYSDKECVDVTPRYTYSQEDLNLRRSKQNFSSWLTKMISFRHQTFSYGASDSYKQIIKADKEAMMEHREPTQLELSNPPF